MKRWLASLLWRDGRPHASVLGCPGYFFRDRWLKFGPNCGWGLAKQQKMVRVTKPHVAAFTAAPSESCCHRKPQGKMCREISNSVAEGRAVFTFPSPVSFPDTQKCPLLSTSQRAGWTPAICRFANGYWGSVAWAQCTMAGTCEWSSYDFSRSSWTRIAFYLWHKQQCPRLGKHHVIKPHTIHRVTAAFAGKPHFSLHFPSDVESSF